MLRNNYSRCLKMLYRSCTILVVFLLSGTLQAFAAGPPAPSALNNTLALTLITLMLILLLVIVMLGRLLTGLADIKMQKEKEEKKKMQTPVAVITGVLILLAGTVMAQEQPATAVAASKTIGGLSAFAFYTMITVIFVEMIVILALLYNIRFLLKKDSVKAALAADASVAKWTLRNWWNNMNKFKPVEQEADIELDHEYDGIRELDNRLPPWWLYGFYATIIIGVIYFWRYHVSYSAPLSQEEFEISVKKADEEVKAYLAKKGETVDENTVTVSTDAADIAEGKKIYTTACVACHKADGGGMVGPNLTDDYWKHGGDIKSIFKTIKYGINAMPQWQTSYSNKQIAQVASYVMSLHGTNPPGAKAAEGQQYKGGDAAATTGK